MKIIINADDFGMSRVVNEAIIKAIEHKHVTSATILANGPKFNDVIKMFKESPELLSQTRLSFGAHLDAFEFRPLTTNTDIEPLLETNGNFNGNVLRRINLTSAMRKALLQEWQEQIQLLFSNGIPVSHIDSHSHTHTIPSVFLILKELQRYHGIRTVRITHNFYSKPPSKSLLFKKAIFNFALRNIFRTRTTDFFTGFEDFFTSSNCMTKLPKVFQKRNTTCELMIHPGNPCPLFTNENIFFQSEWLSNLTKDIELISYKELI